MKRFTCSGSSGKEPAPTFALIGYEGGVLFVAANWCDRDWDMSKVFSRMLFGRVTSKRIMYFASREGKGERSGADEVRRGKLKQRGSPISVRSISWTIACESKLGHSPSCERS